MRRDPGGVFRFAALQSALAARVLARHGADARDLDSVYVVEDYEGPGERVVGRSDAVILVLRRLAEAAELRSAGQPGAAVPTRTRADEASASPRAALHPALWRMAAACLRCIPRAVRDLGYRVVARTRYRVFGRYDTCPVPSAETRERFLDL